METIQTPSAAPPSCFSYHKLESELPNTLKRCAKCQDALYCSRACQKNDWKQHKRLCSFQDSTSSQLSSPPPPSPQQSTGRHNPGFGAIDQLFGRSYDNYLHALPEKEAFAQIIDCFRMRMEDEYVFAQKNIGVYGEEDPVPVFRRFLNLAESRPGLLPPWWDAQKRRECERLSVKSNDWSNIHCTIEKSDIQEHYNNNMMPMMLRVLGEKIYGRGFM